MSELRKYIVGKNLYGLDFIKEGDVVYLEARPWSGNIPILNYSIYNEYGNFKDSRGEGYSIPEHPKWIFLGKFKMISPSEMFKVKAILVCRKSFGEISLGSTVEVVEVNLSKNSFSFRKINKVISRNWLMSIAYWREASVNEIESFIKSSESVEKVTDKSISPISAISTVNTVSPINSVDNDIIIPAHSVVYAKYSFETFNLGEMFTTTEHVRSTPDYPNGVIILRDYKGNLVGYCHTASRFALATPHQASNFRNGFKFIMNTGKMDVGTSPDEVQRNDLIDFLDDITVIPVTVQHTELVDFTNEDFF